MQQARMALLVAGCAVAGCQGDADPPEAVAEWSVSPEAGVTIGAVEGDSTQLLQSVVGAFRSPTGAIVIGDAGIPGIRVFSGAGRFLGQFGRRGDGPGEFMNLRAIWFEPPNSVGAWDSHSRRVTRFALSGELEESRTLTSPDAGNLDVFVGSPGAGDLLLASIALGEGSPLRTDRVTLQRIDDQGAVVALATLPGLVRSQRSPIPFSPYPYFAMIGDTVLFTDGAEAVVRVGVGSRSEDTLRFPDAPPPPDGVAASLEAALRARNSPMLMFLDEAPPVGAVPQLVGLLTDDQGRVWARQYSAPDDALWLNSGGRPLGGLWWVSSVQGRLLARVRVPDGLRPLHIADGRILALTVDELGVERIQLLDLLAGR